MDIKDAHIGQRVRTVSGVTGKIAKICESGYVTIGDANDTPPSDYTAYVANVEPVCDPCASYEMAATITSQCKQIAELQRSVDAWTETAARHCRNESYYRDELTKLQQEARLESDEHPSVWTVAPTIRIGDKVCLHGKAKTVSRCYNGQSGMLPLSEVAKCYKQVNPEDLFLSDDAKIVCEFMRANGPTTSYEISERLHMLERCVIESLIEAKEAGIVRLDDGKYSIVRD